jgi:hypothetical protein
MESSYGGMENMRSYGTILLFAGGVGITKQEVWGNLGSDETLLEEWSRSEAVG